MATKKNVSNDLTQLKKDLKEHSLRSLYFLYGEESYLREYYLDACKKALIGDSPFAEFNLFEFDKDVPLEQLRDAVESYPAMSERKLVIVRDYDPFKASGSAAEFLIELFANLPEYLCLIFYYDTIEFKPDKRTKLYSAAKKTAQFVECTHLDDRQLVDWIKRRFRALGKYIETETCQYMIFLCGNAMVNLITEIEKAASFATVDTISEYHINAVCSPVLDAVIFDLTDAITENRYDKAIALISDLVAQKNSEVSIFSTIFKHIQRLYLANLNNASRGGEKELLSLLGTSSSYFAQKIVVSARKLPTEWLRNALLLCAQTDSELRDSNISDRQKAIELTLLEMCATQRN